MFEVLARHTEELVDLCGRSALWNTCKIMRQQSFMFPLADDVEGGSEIVSFQMACTGVTVCALFVSDDDAILTLKQQVALHLGHLPFAVVFLVDNEVVPFAQTWARAGSPPLMHVILKPRTNCHRLALPSAKPQYSDRPPQ